MEVLIIKKSTTIRVRFSPVVSSANPGVLTFDELKHLWYNQADLASFKSEARHVVAHYAEYCGAHCDSTRGLENCTEDRRKHKYTTIQCTLSAYKKGIGVDHTATIARRCSAWNAEIAFVQAYHNYCDIYDPPMAKMIPKTTSIPPQFPFAMRKKRVASSDCAAQSSRRIRPRTHR